MFCSSCHERGTLILFTRKIFLISSTLCDLFNLAIRVFHSSLSQPPSNSNKKKQKELKDPKMPKQIPPRRRVVVDSDEEMGPKSARNGDSQAVRVSLSLSLSLSSRILTDIIALFSTSGLGVNINWALYPTLSFLTGTSIWLSGVNTQCCLQSSLYPIFTDNMGPFVD